MTRDVHTRVEKSVKVWWWWWWLNEKKKKKRGMKCIRVDQICAKEHGWRPFLVLYENYAWVNSHICQRKFKMRNRMFSINICYSHIPPSPHLKYLRLWNKFIDSFPHVNSHYSPSMCNYFAGIKSWHIPSSKIRTHTLKQRPTLSLILHFPSCLLERGPRGRLVSACGIDFHPRTNNDLNPPSNGDEVKKIYKTKALILTIPYRVHIVLEFVSAGTTTGRVKSSFRNNDTSLNASDYID